MKILLICVLFLAPCKVVSPLVRNVIAIHAGEHHVTQAPVRHSLGDLFRLLGIQRRWRAARLHRAKAMFIYHG